MLVSILICAYNTERWIYEAIRSAVDQSWQAKEVIIVDDGSTDGTLKIAKAFESPVVKVVSQENRGAASARNRALCLAQGDYIQWLDADDVLDRDKIAIQAAVARELGDPRILLSSSFGHFYCARQRARFVPTPLWQDLNPVDWLIAKFSFKMSGMNPAVWLVSRGLSERAGPWNESLTLNDDGEYFCRVVAASQFVRFVPEARSYYRHWNAGSLNRSSSLAACESLFSSLSLSIEHLLSLEDSPRTKEAAVKSLQARLHYFYPEKSELLDKLNHLAQDLGGSLTTPELPFKDRLIWRLFGWRAARMFRRTVGRVKLSTRYTYDRFRVGLLDRGNRKEQNSPRVGR